MGMPGAVVELSFHAPIAVAGKDRKTLCREAYRAVAAGVAAANAAMVATEGRASFGAPRRARRLIPLGPVRRNVVTVAVW
jgi:hypothetical protein